MILTKINVLHSVSLNSYSDCQHGQKADYFSNLCNTSSVQMCVPNRTRLPKCLWISRNKLENGSTGIMSLHCFLILFLHCKILKEAVKKCEEDLECSGFTFQGCLIPNVEYEIYFFHLITDLRDDSVHLAWTTYFVSRDDNGLWL